jgi:hypothetical protein
MKDEIWKDVKGYEGLYQISSYGIVKSLPRELYAHGVRHSHNGKIMKHSKVNDYNLYTLYKDKKAKRYLAHQLVAMSFLNHAPCNNKLVVDHIDNNPLNNHFLNLQLISNRLNLSKDKKNKTSKYTGVTLYRDSKRWISSIRINGKSKHIGIFDCELKAHYAYQQALKEDNATL